jgi:branched-chain amino acid transport system substrate-binding protein
MKKILGILIIVLVLTGLGLYFAKNKTENAIAQPIKIGVMLPLTGPAQTAGEASKKAVELALANLPSDIRENVQIVFEDDQLDAKLAVSAAQKLISVDKVKALITYGSGSSVAVSYVAEKSAIPMIGLGNASDINSGKQYAIRYIPSSSLLIDALEKLIIKGKYKKVAIIWNQADGPKANTEQTVKTFPALGYEIVANESVAKGENDFKTSIAKIKSAKPDVIISYLSPQIGIFAKQVQDIGWKIPIVGIINFEASSQIKIAGTALDNQLYVGAQNADFLDEYFAKYNMYPATAGDNLYDAVTQMAKAVVQAKGVNSSIIKLLKKDFTGVSGEYKYLSDGSFDLKQVVKTWNGSKFIEVK